MLPQPVLIYLAIGLGLIGIQKAYHPNPPWLDGLTLGILGLGIPVWIHNFLVVRRRGDSAVQQLLGGVMVVWAIGSCLLYGHLLRT